MMKRGETLMSLWGKRFLYFDGAMGTLLQARGLKAGEEPERWNIARPQLVKEVHLAYLEAGCDIIASNTFGATRAHLGEDADALMTAGVKVAMEAVREAGHGWVAADISSLGRLLQPYGDMPFEEAVQQFREAAQAGLTAGADLVLIETMTDLLELKAAVLGAREAMEAVGLQVPLFCSAAFDGKRRLLTGADIRGTAAMLVGLGADAVGLNCGLGPKDLLEHTRELFRWCEKPVFISPNAGVPVVVSGITTFPTDAKDFAQEMVPVAELGVWGLGGCCGTTPAHLESMIRSTKGLNPLPRHGEEACVISGRSVSLAMGEKPLLIGERINPTGKPRMKQALREGDLDFLLREAVAQAEAGADALDVNVGLPGINEPEMLSKAVTAIQTVCELPLQIDSADAQAMEAALRVYAGKPIINSVSGKQEVLTQVLPLARKYGGALVVLLLDDNGIPDTAQGRLAIARRVIREAERWGIPRRELLFDALTLAASGGEGAPGVTLETLRLLREELGVKTVLGVSNVSFGLPQRPLLTAAFTAMAIGQGLSAAILNPLEPMVRAMMDAASAISGRDEGFARYLAAYGGQGDYVLTSQPREQETAGNRTLESDGAAQSLDPAAQAILQGLASQAAMLVRARLEEGSPPLGLVESCVMPGLAEAGNRYEQGGLFLPQLLQSAQAAQAAFEEIRRRLPREQADQGKKVVLATVQGDVHDIGKNIVKVLLQNYGYSVVDLGRDVPPQSVLEAVQSSHAKLVGLSALMTTTVPAMERTIALLKRETPDVRVMVGGAVLTQEYADQIGADGYGKDAMAAVRLAERFCASQEGESGAGAK